MTLHDLTRAAALARELVDVRDWLQWFDRPGVSIACSIHVPGRVASAPVTITPDELRELLLRREFRLIAELSALGVTFEPGDVV